MTTLKKALKEDKLDKFIKDQKVKGDDMGYSPTQKTNPPKPSLRGRVQAQGF